MPTSSTSGPATARYRTPRARANHLGSAGGTHHWITINVTSILLVPLTILFVVPFAQVLGGPHEEVLALYRQPFHAIVAMLFIGVTFHHLWQGLQVVIEDYIHHRIWLVGALLANTAFCFVAGVAGIFAVLRIAFSG
ncbi:MAG: succinate dehydrogenase, hydrophobic membrane anchor protein [Paracoccaceae bacterium]